MSLLTDCEREQREAWLCRMRARFVQVDAGVIDWDGERFYSAELRHLSGAIAYRTEGQDADLRKYPLLACFVADRVCHARRIAARRFLARGLARIISKCWQRIKAL